MIGWCSHQPIARGVGGTAMRINKQARGVGGAAMRIIKQAHGVGGAVMSCFYINAQAHAG